MADRAGDIQLRDLLQSATVGELTRKVRLKLAPTDSIKSAAALMRNRSDGCALVFEDDERLVGIVTERDLLHALNGGHDFEEPLSTLMTENPQTVTTDDSLFTAIRLMDEGGYRRLPVLEADGSPAGVVDVKTVSGFLVEHYPEAVFNQASREQLTARNREGA